MDLQTRKTEFVQEFLKIQSEELISQFEKLLNKGKRFKKKTLEPISLEELNNRIDQSESDFANNRFKSSTEILSKYQK